MCFFSQKEKRLVGGLEGVSILSTPPKACTECWNRLFSSSKKDKANYLGCFAAGFVLVDAWVSFLSSLLDDEDLLGRFKVSFVYLCVYWRLLRVVEEELLSV